MKILALTNINFFFVLIYCIPSFASTNKNYLDNKNNLNETLTIEHTHMNNQRNIIYSNKNKFLIKNLEYRNQQVLLEQMMKDSVQNENISKKESVLKNNFDSNLKADFKDLSNTYVSPFGKAINRAPDESLMNCTSRACYE